MSLILEGIDLPSEGEDMTIEINSNGDVRAYSTVLRVIDHDIRAIQIPKGHGRLIDRDDIYIGRWDIDTDLAEQIQNAPTILESEE